MHNLPADRHSRSAGMFFTSCVFFRAAPNLNTWFVSVDCATLEKHDILIFLLSCAGMEKHRVLMWCGIALMLMCLKQEAILLLAKSTGSFEALESTFVIFFL